MSMNVSVNSQGTLTLHGDGPPRAMIKDGRLHCIGRAIKATIPLDPWQFVGLAGPNGPPVKFAVSVGTQQIMGQFNSKSLRRVIAMVAEHGAEAVFVMAQGNLVGTTLDNAGIAAQVKAAPRAEGET